jgi:hypothetical protein
VVTVTVTVPCPCSTASGTPPDAGLQGVLAALKEGADPSKPTPPPERR